MIREGKSGDRRDVPPVICSQSGNPVETRGQTGRTPVISSQSGNRKVKTKVSVVRRRIFSVRFLLWLDCRVSWSRTFLTMLRSGTKTGDRRDVPQFPCQDPGPTSFIYPPPSGWSAPAVRAEPRAASRPKGRVCRSRFRTGGLPGERTFRSLG